MPPVPAPPHEHDDDELPALIPGTGSPRLQRWVDLLAALLGRRGSVSFDDLACDVPAYHAKAQQRDATDDPARRRTLAESLKRTFERDKDDLRSLGAAIESLPDEHGNPAGVYRLRRENFYLPYLAVTVPGGSPSVPPRVDAYGYQTLSTLTLEPDELAAIVDAAATVRGLGDPLLRADIDSAMRKLAVDLRDHTGAPSADTPRAIASRLRPDADVFVVLSGALRARKRVTFSYHAMSSDRTESRTVEPYGLFFLSSHWYLAGRDSDRGELRNFRLNRITGATVRSTAKQTPDFAVPGSFRLRAHAQSRQAWELGDADVMDGCVEFRGDSGPTLAAAALGMSVDGAPRQRLFRVRRTDSFARWILSFAGEAVVLSPPSLAAQVRDTAAATLALYAHDMVARDAPLSAALAPPRGRTETWEPKGAAAQLQRLLAVVPQLADGKDHSLKEVADRTGTDVATLVNDLHSLVDRYDMPGGFVESVQVYVDPDTVSTHSHHFRRPMRLTVNELCALELGLAVLRVQRPPDEHAVLAAARHRLQAVIAKLPGDAIPDALYHVSLGEVGSTVHLDVVRHGVRTRTKVHLGYRRSGRDTTDERIVCPYALVAASGMLYLIAHCDRAATLRFFRMDRVQSAEATAVCFTVPGDFALDDVLRDGKPFLGTPGETMRVRYGPRIARWIAEREERTLDADGALVLESPLADMEWGMRHVLQYGPDAEVLYPPALRALLRDQLTQLVAEQ